jgi:alkanesulfonate monooxygenase SsuD/methylene tetrahydromethanopterin reductase-like flavin-dependent oxidoreductase (luciferase family)
VGRRLERDGGLGGQARHEPAELDAEDDETGEPFHVQQAEQIRALPRGLEGRRPRATPRVSVSRSIFALVNDRDRAYFGGGNEDDDKIGFIDEQTRAIFGRSYAAEPDVLIEQLAQDEAIAEADTLLLTVPNQLGVDYNAHVIEAILTHVAPALGLALRPGTAEHRAPPKLFCSF